MIFCIFICDGFHIFLWTQSNKLYRARLLYYWASEKRMSCIPANTRLWASAGFMLGQRRRRWARIGPALGQRLVFAGILNHATNQNQLHIAIIHVASLYYSCDAVTIWKKHGCTIAYERIENEEQYFHSHWERCKQIVFTCNLKYYLSLNRTRTQSQDFYSILPGNQGKPGKLVLLFPGRESRGICEKCLKSGKNLGVWCVQELKLWVCCFTHNKPCSLDDWLMLDCSVEIPFLRLSLCYVCWWLWDMVYLMYLSLI